MRRVFGCTLAVLFSATCAHAQPKEHARTDHAVDMSEEVEIDYSGLAQAEIRRAAADRAASYAKWDEARAGVLVDAKHRMTAEVSTMMGIVPVTGQKPLAVPGFGEPGIVEQVEIPGGPGLENTKAANNDTLSELDDPSRSLRLDAEDERLVAEANEDEAIRDSEFVRSGV